MANLRERFKTIRSRTQEITAPLQTEDYVVQPVVDVSPPKWHLAHTSWFFETFVLKKNKNYKEFHPDFNFLFNSYYQSVGERSLRVNRGNITRPGVSEVLAYREHVNAAMDEFLSSDLDAAMADIVELGLQHEQQHQELLTTDIKYILGHNPIFPVYQEPLQLINEYEEIVSKNPIRVPSGNYTIGHQGKDFCFDNELGVHEVYLEEFELSGNLVSIGEYLEFIKDGGYEKFILWHSEGWEWVEKNNIKSPLYWYKVEGKWHHYTMEGLKPLNMNYPVTHISFYEAHAFAEWKKMRLPTEFEWEVASPQLNCGQRWEWTNSAYLPYPRFEKAEGAIGEYNGKFMINQMVLRGGSCATAPNHFRNTYRNFFHPHLQWQFTGIRLAEKQ